MAKKYLLELKKTPGPKIEVKQLILFFWGEQKQADVRTYKMYKIIERTSRN